MTTLHQNATRRQDQLEHLAQVNALRQAVSSAILAIDKNDLSQFEAYLTTQEQICNRLGAKLRATPEKEASGDPDPSLRDEIQQSYLALAHLNRIYATLLKSAQRSCALILSLYRSYGEGYDRGPSPPSQGHTWSCEV